MPREQNGNAIGLVVPSEVREAAEAIEYEFRGWDIEHLDKRDQRKLICARYIASIAEPAAGKQLAGIHYMPTAIHDGPP